MEKTSKIWSDEEKAILNVIYPRGSKKNILKVLPARSWNAIQNQAVELGIKREIWTAEKKYPDPEPKIVKKRMKLADFMDILRPAGKGRPKQVELIKDKYNMTDEEIEAIKDYRFEISGFH